jgi:hypothetical protein
MWLWPDGSKRFYPPTLGKNYPRNTTYSSINGKACTAELASCFATTLPHEAFPINWLKDFEDYDESNPIPQAEFGRLLNAVAEDFLNPL